MTDSTAESRPVAFVTGASRGLGKQHEGNFTAGTPEQIGAAVAWLCTDPAAERHRGSIVLAQKITKDHNLL